MIRQKQWKQIKHFKPNEAFGNLNLFKFKVLKLLDQQTEFAKNILYSDRKIYCIVHSGTQGIHSKDSQHYKGWAVDVHYTNMSLFEQVMLSLLFPWSAIGFYPTWNSQGVHLDLRIQKWYERKAMWYTYNKVENGKLIVKYENNKQKILNKLQEL